MKIIERIENSIAILENPESGVFSFDEEAELLYELKGVVEKRDEERNVIESNNKEISELSRTVSALRQEKDELERKYAVSKNELGKFYTLIQKELSGKMKVLGYGEEEVRMVAEMDTFQKVYEMRNRVLYEFDRKFNGETVVKETPKQTVIKVTNFKL